MHTYFALLLALPRSITAFQYRANNNHPAVCSAKDNKGENKVKQEEWRVYSRNYALPLRCSSLIGERERDTFVLLTIVLLLSSRLRVHLKAQLFSSLQKL